MLGWLYLRASAPPTGIYKRFFCCSSATFGTLFPNFCAVGTPLFFNISKTRFFGLPTVCWGRRRDVAHPLWLKWPSAEHAASPFFLLPLFLLLVVLLLLFLVCFSLLGIFRFLFLTFFQETQAEVAAAAAATAREGEMAKVSPLLARLFSCCQGAASVWNSEHRTMIKRSAGFKEEQGSKTECCIERRVHQKNKMKTTPVAPGPECKGRASGDETKEAESFVLGFCCPFIISQ